MSEALDWILTYGWIFIIIAALAFVLLPSPSGQAQASGQNAHQHDYDELGEFQVEDWTCTDYEKAFENRQTKKYCDDELVLTGGFRSLNDSVRDQLIDSYDAIQRGEQVSKFRKKVNGTWTDWQPRYHYTVEIDLSDCDVPEFREWDELKLVDHHGEICVEEAW